jgi:glutamine amidotransferase
MCIIIYSPEGNIPKNHLAAAMDRNKDGWGAMWPAEGKLQIMKGMKAEEFRQNWSWFRNLRVPVVFHARIATHGTTDLDNCHPFLIPQHGQLALAHNGIIGRCAYANDKNKSDTRVFVDTMLKILPRNFHRNAAIREFISDYIGHSKLVIMDGQGKTTIINEKQGTWDDGIWYSNDTYKPWGTKIYTGYDGRVSHATYYNNVHRAVGCEDRSTYLRDAHCAASWKEYYEQETKKSQTATNYGKNDVEELGCQADELPANDDGPRDDLQGELFCDNATARALNRRILREKVIAARNKANALSADTFRGTLQQIKDKISEPTLLEVSAEFAKLVM